MTQIYPNKILFTGSGFSMDFGGFSVQQMSEEMFNVVEGEALTVREALIGHINDVLKICRHIKIIDPNADKLIEEFKNGNNIKRIHSKTLNAYLSN